MSGALTISPELENILLEYVIRVIVDDPSDLISHAADYFTNLRDRNRDAELETVVAEGSREEIARLLSNRATRRGTVVGETYNPEKDEGEDEIQVIPKSDSERERIKSLAKNMFLFRALNTEDVDAVIDAMAKKTVEQGQTIIKQGDDGDFLYIIGSGIYHVYMKDKNGKNEYIAAYDNQGFFGELSLLHNQPRAATIKADTEGLLWAVDRKTFNKVIVRRAFGKRQMYMKLLEGVAQLQPLTEYEKMQVADALVAKSFSGGDMIVKEGDEGDGMYFIVEGKVQVVKQKTSDDGTEEEEEIAQLGMGDYFGELALIEHKPRAATVIASEDTTSAFLEVAAFERLLGPCLDIMKRHTETYDKNKPAPAIV